MKYLAYILSLFILLSSLQPCQDIGDSFSSDTSISLINYDQQDHSTEHQDSCSPFCSCSCCGITSTHIGLNTVYQKEELPELQITHQSFYKNLYYQEFIDVIIHPPIS